jgi:hypothetical protein
MPWTVTNGDGISNLIRHRRTRQGEAQEEPSKTV